MFKAEIRVELKKGILDAEAGFSAFFARTMKSLCSQKNPGKNDNEIYEEALQ